MHYDCVGKELLIRRRAGWMNESAVGDYGTGRPRDKAAARGAIQGFTCGVKVADRRDGYKQKKPLQMQELWKRRNGCGRCWIRTNDPLLVREVL